MSNNSTQPRGIRNHNPGNIRLGAKPWQGEVPGADTAFCTFAAPVFGLRALARLLLTYQSKYGLDTVKGLLTRYAPAIENDTGAYIGAVSKKLNVTPTQQINVGASLLPLMRAIVAHENGRGWEDHYPETLYQQAIDMTLGAK